MRGLGLSAREGLVWTRTDDIVSSPTVPHRSPSSPVIFCHPLLSSGVFWCPLVSSGVRCCPPLPSVVPCCAPPAPTVFHCFPVLSAVFRRSLSSPAALYHYLPPPVRSCVRSWGSSYSLITAALRIQVPGRTTLCCPVLFSGPGGSPPGPLEAPVS